MSCTNNINITCGCENNPCGCKTSSDDVVYQGPDLSCTGVSNCDTLTEVIQSIDGFICSPEMVQTIINNILNNISLYNQFTTIVNNTVDCQTVWDCIEAQTTTTTTTLVPTTTTTTTVKSCIEVTFDAGSACGNLGYAIIQYTDCDGVLQTVNITTGELPTYCSLVGSPSPAYICGTGGFVFGSTCPAPTTTTTTTATPTTTTTTTAPTCLIHKLAASGPSVLPGDNAWSAIDCYTGLPVDGTITFPTSVNTGCIIDSSLVLGVKVEIIETNACPTTTTTTTT